MSGDVKRRSSWSLRDVPLKDAGGREKIRAEEDTPLKNMQSETQRKKINAKDGPVFPQFCQNAQPRLQILVFKIIHLKVKL